MSKKTILSVFQKENVLDWCKQHNYSITAQMLVNKFNISLSQAYRIINVHIPLRTGRIFIPKKIDSSYQKILIIIYVQESENQITITTKDFQGSEKKYQINKISASKIYGIPKIGQSIMINKVNTHIILSYELYQYFNGKLYSYDELYRKKKTLDKENNKTIQKIFNCNVTSIAEITEFLKHELPIR